MHQPGERFTYGLSVDVLGRLIEVLSGQPLDKYLRTRLFEPLNMKDTWFYLPADKHARLAELYERTGRARLAQKLRAELEAPPPQRRMRQLKPSRR